MLDFSQFVDSVATSERTVPGRRALRWAREYRVGVEKASPAVVCRTVLNACDR